MRWQISGYLSILPNATPKELTERFASGSGISGGSLKKAYIEQDWETQTKTLAKIILTNSISEFEYFTSEIARLTTETKDKKDKISKNLQFPNTRRNKAYNDLGPKLPELHGSFHADSFISNKSSPYNIDNLLKCYRFFKEIRNDISHNGSKSTQSTVDAYNEFRCVSNTVDLGTKEVPDHTPINTLNEDINLSIRGVIGFTDILMRIICTYDVEFSEYPIAVAELQERYPVQIPGIWLRHDTEIKRMKQIAKKLDRDGTLPRATPTEDFASLLREKRIIPSYA
ncbi:hypothetical protein [Castellaniella sp.]|uniref:hypothetical protein n=1 Tax=Castellaniella sp. TaxID=1955812 RepID=UPI002AFDF6CD|nr:hypothetical protein [Castellaniella sp.]